MGNTNSQSGSSTIPHHIVLHLTDQEIGSPTVDHSSSTSKAPTTADVKDAKSFADLVAAATKSFRNPPNDHQFCFYAPDNSEIKNDQQLVAAWQEAIKVIQQNNNANDATENNNNNNNSSSSTSADENTDFACHIDVTIESTALENREASTSSAADPDGKKQLHEYQNLEFELPHFAKTERDVSSGASFAANADNEKKSSSPTSCDVLFIGAGPVGLWTAVQLKIRAPHLNILMVEKYAVFQRKHVVLLNARSLWFMPNDRRLKKFASSLPPAIRTNDLEDRLSKLAGELGISIIIEAVTSVESAIEKYKPLCVVGSDGSHSIVRKKFMTHGNSAALQLQQNADGGESLQDPSLAVDEIVDNTVVVKYEICKNAEGLSPVDLYTIQKMLPFKSALGLFEHVSGKFKDKDGAAAAVDSEKKKGADGKDDESADTTVPKSTSPAVLIISGVPTFAMETVKGATFRNPIRIDERDADAKAKWLKMHASLRATVAGYLKAKEIIKGELRDAASVAISPVPLRVYRARWFAEVVENKQLAASVPSRRKVATFLVGDSAQGQPYFRALNNGFYAGSRLASLLADALDDKDQLAMAQEISGSASFGKVQSSLKSAVDRYHLYMLMLSSKEILRARANATAFSLAREIVSIQSQSPMQAIKLHYDQAKVIQAAMDEQMLNASGEGEKK